MCQTVGIGCLAGPKKSARVWDVEVQPMCWMRGECGARSGSEKSTRVSGKASSEVSDSRRVGEGGALEVRLVSGADVYPIC